MDLQNHLDLAKRIATIKNGYYDIQYEQLKDFFIFLSGHIYVRKNQLPKIDFGPFEIKHWLFFKNSNISEAYITLKKLESEILRLPAFCRVVMDEKKAKRQLKEEINKLQEDWLIAFNYFSIPGLKKLYQA